MSIDMNWTTALASAVLVVGPTACGASQRAHSTPAEEARREARYDRHGDTFTFEEPSPEPPSRPERRGRWVEGRRVYLHAPEPCGTGPYEFRLPVTPSPGREISLRAYSPRRLALVLEVPDGDRARRQTIGARWSDTSLDAEHADCRVMAADGERVIVRVPEGGQVVPLVSSETVPIAPTQTFEQTQTLQQSSDQTRRQLSAAMSRGSIEDDDHTASGMRGNRFLNSEELVVKIWSPRALNLRSVVFEIVEKHFEVLGGLETWEAAWRDYDARRAAYQDARDAWNARRQQAYNDWVAASPARRVRPRPGPSVSTPRGTNSRRQTSVPRARWTDRNEALRAHQARRRDRRITACSTDTCREQAWFDYCALDLDRRDPECRGVPNRRERARAARAARYHASRSRSERQAAHTLPMATEPPPPPRAEHTPPRPNDDAQWIPGSWRWTGERYEWLSGLWRVPNAPVEVAVATAPPSLPADNVPPAPSADAVWVPGHHKYERGYQTVPGQWVQPPQRDSRWQPPSFHIRGGLRIFIPGAWVNSPRTP